MLQLMPYLVNLGGLSQIRGCSISYFYLGKQHVKFCGKCQYLLHLIIPYKVYFPI